MAPLLDGAIVPDEGSSSAESSRRPTARQGVKMTELFAQMWDAWQRGDRDEAERLHEELLPHMRLGCPLCTG